MKRIHPLAPKAQIHIVLILGSIRPNSYTGKVLEIVLDEIRKTTNVSMEVIDPQFLSLPFPGQNVPPEIEGMQKAVAAATGVILATPEYHGSYSSVMKLIIENLGYPSVLAGKPVALMGIASGEIGAIKALEHLSSVCAHIGAFVLPGPVSVAGVHKLFDKEGRCRDKDVEQRIRDLANTLISFIRTHILPRVALEETVRRE